MMRQYLCERYLFGSILVVALGCSAKQSAPPPTPSASPGGMPPLEAPSAGADKSAGKLPPGHPPIGGTPTETPGQPGDPGQVLSGTIVVAPKLKDAVKPGDVVFLSVRQDQGGTPGQVLAVDRFEAKAFPIAFAIDGSKAMVPGTKFTGAVLVTARVDKDGDAMTKNPGDLQGVLKATIPAKRLAVTIDTALP